MSQKRDLELIYELGCLRFIQRSWKQFFGPDIQNLAEHHFRVAWIAMLLVKMEGRGDIGKILQMALVHDLPESRTGDAHFISQIYTKRNEDQAINDITKDTSFGRDLVNLWREYEKHESIESQIVKDADNLDVDFEIQEQEMKGQNQFSVWKNERKNLLKDKLYTKSAKKLWKAITKSTPYEWHKNARNRINSGDWKKKK